MIHARMIRPNTLVCSHRAQLLPLDGESFGDWVGDDGKVGGAPRASFTRLGVQRSLSPSSSSTSNNFLDSDNPTTVSTHHTRCRHHHLQRSRRSRKARTSATNTSHPSFPKSPSTLTTQPPRKKITSSINVSKPKRTNLSRLKNGTPVVNVQAP